MAAQLELPAVPPSSRRKAAYVEPAEGGMLSALAETAARALAMPWASITIVEGERIAISVAHGFERAAMDATQEFAFCTYVANVSERFALENVAPADALSGTLCALGPTSARAFAHVPIVIAGGACIGALCVFDREPRSVSSGQMDTLSSLAGLVARQLAVHAELHEANVARRELSTLIGAFPVAVTTLEADGRVLSWSAAAERLSGYAAQDVIGRFPPWVPGGRDNRGFRELLAAIRRGASYLNQRSRRVRADGTSIDIRVSAAPMFADDGSVIGCVAMAENVEELERAERRRHLFESAACKASDAVFVTSSLPADDPEITWINEAFTTIFGYSEEEIVGKPVSFLRAPDADPRVARRVVRARRRLEALRGRVLYARKNGETFWCESSLSPVVEDDGACEHWVVIARDVTELSLGERLQADRANLLEMIAADAPMENIFAALVASAERARPGSGAMIRLRRGEVLYRAAFGTAFADALGALDAPVALGDAADMCGRAAGASEQVVVDLTRADVTASEAALRAHGVRGAWSSPIRGAGEVFGTFAMYATSGVPPVSADLRLGVEFARLAALALERHEDREQLEFLAMHDALTGLPNRKLFQIRLDAAIGAAERGGRNVALGMIDLNRFKLINDSLGHAVGDQLLRDVAGRLARSVRPGDTIARLGGDEFVLLIDDLGSRDEALEIAERVLLALVPSFDCGGQEVFVRASMGLSTYPADAPNADELLALGDAAMYEAKSQGREVAFHVRGDDRQGIARIALEASLNHALEKQEFELVFQPQVELRTREIRGAEALLRWNHPIHGLMLPDTFVRLAEDTGLIVPIGTWVLEEACKFARQWQDEGFDRFVSVNVSARQFDRPEFVELVTSTLARTGLEANRLHLELTESLVMRSPEKAAATLSELKTLGVKIVIDDFGTGYSSFNYLKRFPLDALKIDRLFVRDIGFGSRAPNDEAIVRAIVGVARALDLKIIAEGVENEDQVAFLRAIGVPLAQGFLFARGLRPAAALRWTQTASRR